MMDKLRRYGVNGTSLQFIKSYFADRKQYVTYSGVKSGTVEQNLGTIQGSKNGPRFFDIYIYLMTIRIFYMPMIQPLYMYTRIWMF